MEMLSRISMDFILCVCVQGGGGFTCVWRLMLEQMSVVGEGLF